MIILFAPLQVDVKAMSNILWKIFPLILVTGCGSSVVTSPDGPRLSLTAFLENQTAYDTISYLGVKKDTSGKSKLVFQFINPRNETICVPRNSLPNYFGRIDYLNQDGTSYRNSRDTSISLAGDLDSFTSSDTIYFATVSAGGVLQIEREIFEGMFPFGNDLFKGVGPFFATLEVRNVFECIPEQIENGLSAYEMSLEMEKGNFIFRSGKIGPFMLPQE